MREFTKEQLENEEWKPMLGYEDYCEASTLGRIKVLQRKVIEKVTGKAAKKTPQLWALYSEVLEYYDQGMTVPDDVMILLLKVHNLLNLK